MAQLGDLLAGAAGRPVDRIGLEAAVMQGQAMAGLRSSQTEEALLNAQRMREEQAAGDQLESAYMAQKKPDGTPMYSPSDAHMLALQQKFVHGSHKDALAAYQEQQKAQAFATVADPNADANARLASDQALNPGQNPYQAVEGQVIPRFAPNSQTGPANIQQSPVSGSVVDKNEAEALLNRAKAEHPHEFQGNYMSPDMVGIIAQYVRQNPDARPTGRALFSPAGAATAAALTDNNGPAGAAPVVPQLPPAGASAATGQPTTPGQGPNGAPSTTPFGHLSFKEQSGIRNDFANGIAAKQTTALNTMFQHSQLFDKIADQLGNGNFAPTNAINVLWQRVFGSAAPSNLATAGAFLGREAVRATVNSGSGTGEERELQVGANSSPEALHGAASTLRSLAGGQLHSLNRRATRGGVDITQLLEPEAAAAYGLQSHTEPATVPTGTTTPSVMSLDDFLKSKGH